MLVLLSHRKYVIGSVEEEHCISCGHTDRKTEKIQFKDEEEFNKWLETEYKSEKYENVTLTILDCNLSLDSPFLRD